jgi:hypothetical protein
MRRYKRRGMVATTSIRAEDLTRFRQILRDYHPQSLYSSSVAQQDSFYLIVDTGCSQTATGCIDDFIPGSLHDLERPIEMEGIAGGLQIRQKGRVTYELLTDDGDVHVLETTAYFMPDLP